MYLQQIRAHVLAAFGTDKNPRSRIRNSDVTEYVAECMRREKSSALGRDVLQAMRFHGWSTVRHARLDWWKGIRRL